MESMFGNTRQVAEAVGEGMAEGIGESRGAEVEVRDAGEAPAILDEDLDLLVVGGPTHAFGLSRTTTRADAVAQGGRDRSGAGVREWLDVLEPVAGRRVAVATFDSRIKKPLVPGSAARGAARRLRRLGFRPLGTATSFFVLDTQGPLRTGEEQRAREWGRALVEQLAPAASGRG